MKKTALIDLDNTAADFQGAYEIALKKEPGIIYPHSQYGFFENLEPMPGFVDVYFALKRKFNVYMCSRSSVNNPMSYTEKRVWVEKALGFPECEKLILACDKTMVKGHYLIDVWTQEGLVNC